MRLALAKSVLRAAVVVTAAAAVAVVVATEAAAPGTSQSKRLRRLGGILSSGVPDLHFMPNQSVNTPMETRQQRFESVLSRERFKGLKAILDSLSLEPGALYAGVNGASSYEELLTRLGFRVTLIKQIHVQDCYSRV